MNPLLPESAQRNLILASRSPRREEILRGLSFDFTIVPPADHVEAGASCDDPFERPLLFARLKAADVAARHPDALVIGADTVVILGDDILEKPADDAEAFEFIRRLAGRTHSVVTGVALRSQSRGIDVADKEVTRVRFRALGDDEVRAYVASGEGRDKAGAYAVQGLGGALVREIDGCYYNVVGLPVALLFDMLERT